MENEEEKESQILGDERTFYTKDDGNIFGIAFDKIFKQEPLTVFDDFELNSKRNFKNLAPMILETYQQIFLDDEGCVNEDLALVLFNMLYAESKILQKSSKNEPMPYEEFISLVDKVTDDGDKLLMKAIGDFVDSHYALELDKITEETRAKKKKVNVELQFSDRHAKDLLKIAYLYRIMIPLVSVYFMYNKNNLVSVVADSPDFDEMMLDVDESVEELKFDEANSKIFAYLFDKFATNPEALRNKLYKFTSSRVSKTSFSDKRFWQIAKNVAVTEKTESLEIYKKLLTNAIPKLSIQKDKNAISFLQSVINNQIDFLFQNKFRDKFIPISIETSKYSPDDNDSNNVSEFEKMELLTTRKDEGSFIIRKLNIADVLPTIPEKMGVAVDDSEVKQLMKTLQRNSIQEGIVSMLTFKYFNDKDAMKYVTFYQYCYLVVACKKYLELKKFIYLPKILIYRCEKHKERSNICGKKVRPDILNSKKYRELFESKYVNFASEIERPFLSIIGTTYSSVFRDADGNDVFDGTVKVAKIAEEILDMAKLI